MRNTILRLAVLGFVVGAAVFAPGWARALEPTSYPVNMPAVSNHISYCDSTYHGLHYCEFSDNFSLPKEEVVTAVTWYDVGCRQMDAETATFFYDIVNADTFEIVTRTPIGAKKTCIPYYPPDHGTPTTLAVDPAKLDAGQAYFVILRVEGNSRIRAQWGTQENHHASFEVHSGETHIPEIKRPVIIVPGILGSSLALRSGGQEIWPDAQTVFGSASDEHLDALKLDRRGNQLPGSEAEPARVLEREKIRLLGIDIEHVIYGNLVERFVDAGYVKDTDLFLVPYDWRFSLKKEASRLAEAVARARRASPDGKVVLVGHSMGGLLIKQYLALLDDVSFVDRVVFAGVPQLGAPGMFKTLQYGDNLGFVVPLIHKELLNAGKVKDISQNMPGAYELLPSKRYTTVNGGYVKDMRGGKAKFLSHEETTALMTADPADSRNRDLLAAARSFHAALDDRPIVGPAVYNLLGCNHSATLGEIRLYDGGRVDIASVNGDGTVPMTSAMRLANGYSNFFVSARETGIDHMGLVRDDRSARFIVQLASAAHPEPPQGISGSSATCFPGADSRPETLRISTHSHKAALHVYDSAGRHTGPAEDGSIDIEIPGSTYTQIGDNNFTFVPATSAHRLRVNSLAAGTLTVQTMKLRGAEPLESKSYADVPVGAEAVATLELLALGQPLQVDQNGDGTTDATFGSSDYAFGGFLPPVASDGSGVYKLGRVLPLRFRIVDGQGNPVPHLKPSFNLVKVRGSVQGRQPIKKLPKRTRFGVGRQFVYRPKTGEYAFDLQTVALTRGTWELELDLGDGQAYSLTLSFK